MRHDTQGNSSRDTRARDEWWLQTAQQREDATCCGGPCAGMMMTTLVTHTVSEFHCFCSNYNPRCPPTGTTNPNPSNPSTQITQVAWPGCGRSTPLVTTATSCCHVLGTHTRHGMTEGCTAQASIEQAGWVSTQQCSSTPQQQHRCQATTTAAVTTPQQTALPKQHQAPMGWGG